MQFGYKSLLALTAIIELASAGAGVDMLQKRDAVVYVKQEILEIVGYTSTVWVAPPPPPSETPEPVPSPVVQEPSPTLTPEPIIGANPTEVPVPIVIPEPSPTPSSSPVEQPPTTGGGGAGTYSGKATFYDAGLGSCGETHSNGDMICALSKVTMSLTAGANPNLNPKCGTQIRVKSNSNPAGIIVTIVDTCPGCLGPNDLDLSPAAYNQLGNPLDGVIDVTWDYV